MKKLLLIIFSITTFSIAMSAQAKAIGGRLGADLEFSYQNYTGGESYFQIDAGLVNYANGIRATGTYNFILASPQWTDYGSWEWFAGFGAGIGYNWYIRNAYWRGNWNAYEDSSHFFIGAVGNIGLAFTFPFQLQLAIDYRPILGPSFGEYYVNSVNNPKRNIAFYAPGLYDFGFSIRYSF